MSATTAAESSEVSTYKMLLQPLTEKEAVSGWDRMGRIVTPYNLNRVLNGTAAVALLGTYLYAPEEYNFTELAIQFGVHTYQALIPENASKVYHTAALALGIASGASIVHHAEGSAMGNNYLYSMMTTQALNFAANVNSLLKGVSFEAESDDEVSDDESVSEADNESVDESDDESVTESDEKEETLEDPGVKNLVLSTANSLPVSMEKEEETENVDDEESVTGEEKSSSKEEDGPEASSKPISPRQKDVETKVAVANPEMPKKVSEPKPGSVETRQEMVPEETVEINEDSNADESSSENSVDEDAGYLEQAAGEDAVSVS